MMTQMAVAGVMAAFCAGYALAEPAARDRCSEASAQMSCPPGQQQKLVSTTRGVCRFVCEEVSLPTEAGSAHDRPMIELVANGTDVVLRCPFNIVWRRESVRTSTGAVDGYYCQAQTNDDLSRTNLLGYVNPGQATVLGAVVETKQEGTATTSSQSVSIQPGKPFAAGYNNQAVIRYSGPVELVAGTPPRHRHHHRRHRAK